MRKMHILAVLGALLVPFGSALQAQVSDTIDVVRPGDILQLRFWPDVALSGEFRVQSSGRVAVPVAGELEAGGRSVDSLRAEIGRRYAETTSNGTVSVTVLFRVSVLGAVSRPGVYSADASLTLLDVIGLAGGFASNADLGAIRLLRDGQTVAVDARGLREGRLENLGLQLRSGDQVFVPETAKPRIPFQVIAGVVQMAAVLTTLFLQLK